MVASNPTYRYKSRCIEIRHTGFWYNVLKVIHVAHFVTLDYSTMITEYGLSHILIHNAKHHLNAFLPISEPATLFLNRKS